MSRRRTRKYSNLGIKKKKKILEEKDTKIKAQQLTTLLEKQKSPSEENRRLLVEVKSLIE
jgi:hypothetical protein